MGRRKGTPERSQVVRVASPLAFSRRNRGSKDDEGGEGEFSDEPTKVPTPTASATSTTVTDGKPVEDASNLDTKPLTAISSRPDPSELPQIEPPAPRDEPWPDATPAPMKPVGAPEHDFGRPPAMPTSAAPPPLVLGDVENPAHMPAPREVPSGNPDDPAPPPGHVPPGDSRSLRLENEFALIYRVGTCVISRTGRIGTRGQWRVVEYPTSAAASSAYAKECSRFVSEGFSDYRD